MTELYINGYLAVLPTGVEFSVVEDNPFLTKSGEYTLDLELDLRNPVNAKIFGHIDRFNRKETLEKLPAILIADSRVRMRGSAVIQGHTGDSIKIQLLSGNSELNYFIGADKKMEELDLGTEAAITQNKALDTLNKFYPESNFVCTPVISEILSVFNEYRYGTVSNIAMMPYLLCYVQKIPEALGYSVVENQLLDDRMLCRLYIPNAKKTLHYNEVLAGWTVEDFLIEIEKFCNVVFVIDREKLSVRIVRFYNWDKNDEKVYIDEVIDDYETEYDSDSEINVINYETVKYDLPSDDYYKYKSLADFVLENTEIEEFETVQDLKAALNPLSAYYNKNKIYHVKKHVLFGFLEIDSDSYYVVEELLENTLYGLLRVNEFSPAGKKDGNTIELKIIPAKMAVYLYNNNSSSQAPLISETDETGEKEEPGVIDLIESGENKSSPAEAIPVAIYMGTVYSGPWSQVDIFVTASSDEKFTYATAWDSVQWQQLPPEQKNEQLNEFLDYLNYTLRLSGKYGLFKTNYSLNKGIASREIRTIRFIPGRKISPQNTFVIKNKEFICISLETKFDIHGALPEVEGKFYPID
jgi:hypothetical protein